jgi:hypothetical protein
LVFVGRRGGNGALIADRRIVLHRSRLGEGMCGFIHAELVVDGRRG